MDRPQPVRIRPEDLAEYPEERKARDLAQGAIRESQRQQALSWHGLLTGEAQKRPARGR